MIRVNNNVFELHTKNTSYLFRLTQTGHLEHLHFNKRIMLTDDVDVLWEKHAFAGGNQCSYDGDNLNISMDEMRLEYSAREKATIASLLLKLYIQTEAGLRILYLSHMRFWIQILILQLFRALIHKALPNI